MSQRWIAGTVVVGAIALGFWFWNGRRDEGAQRPELEVESETGLARSGGGDETAPDAPEPKEKSAAALSAAKPEPSAIAQAEQTPAAAQQQAEPEAAEPAAGSARLTEPEERVLVMYDDMAVAFDANPSDCSAMGGAVRDLVTKHRPAIDALMQSRAHMSASQQAAAQRRVDAAAEERMERVRNAMRSGLTKCANDETLQQALRTLASLNTIAPE